MLARACELLVRASIRRWWLVAAVSTGLSLLAVWGILTRSSTEVGYRIILGENHPAIDRLDWFIGQFGGGLPVIAVWSCDQSPCRSVLDDESLRMAYDVSERLASHSLVRRVLSPANAGVLQSDVGGVGVRHLVENGELPADRDEIRRLALEDPIWRGRLVSPDARAGAIVVQLASSDSTTTARIVPIIQEVLADYESAGYRFHLAGDPVDFVVAGGEMQKENPKLVGILIVLAGIVLWLLSRSLLVASLSLGTAGIAVLWAQGAMAWLGWPQMELTQVVPPIVLVISVCDAIHVFARYAVQNVEQRANENIADRARWLSAVALEVGPPCLLTTLTTAGGLLAFLTSDMESFGRFGLIAALGVLIAFVLSFTLLPVVMSRVPHRRLWRRRSQEGWDGALAAFAHATMRQRSLLVVAAAGLTLVGFGGLALLEIDVDEEKMLGEDSQVVRWSRFVAEHLRPPDTLEIALSAPEGESAISPRGVQYLSLLEEYIDGVEELGTATSILDLSDHLNAALRGGVSSREDPTIVPPLVLTLRMASGDPVGEWLSFDERTARISVEADALSTDARGEVLVSLSSFLDDALATGWRYELSGPLPVYAEFVGELQRTQLRSISAAVVTVIGLVFVFLWLTGSTGTGALGLAAAAGFVSGLPILVTIGMMGFLAIPLDVGTAMVAAVVLGIAVDDSIHLICAYRELRSAGWTASEAISRAVVRVGRALIITSIALSIGFFSLLLSSWQSLAVFGFLSGVAILSSLVADLVLLPAIFAVVAGAAAGPPESPDVVDEPRGRDNLVSSVLLVACIALGFATTIPQSGEIHSARQALSLVAAGGTSIVVWFLVWHSSAGASKAIAILYSAAAIVATISIAGEPTLVSAILLIGALAVLPAAIAHVVLTFPHPRWSVGKRAPEVILVFYGISLLLWGVLTWAQVSHRDLAVTSLVFVQVLIGAGWLVLLARAGLALRDSYTRLERRRARVAFYGGILVAGLCLPFLANGASLPSGFGQALAAIAFPAPLVFAVIYHQLYDVRPALTRLLRTVAFATGYTVGAVALYMSIPRIGVVPGLSVAFVGILAVEVARSRSWGMLHRLREAGEKSGESWLSAPEREEDVAAALSERVWREHDSMGVSLYAKRGQAWVPIGSAGNFPAVLCLDAPEFRVVLKGKGAYLGVEGGVGGPTAEKLRRERISLILPLSWGTRVTALLIVRDSVSLNPYTSDQVRRIERLCESAAGALSMVRISERLRRSDRRLALASLSEGFLHEVVKPLMVIRRHARSLRRELGTRHEELETIEEMATSCDLALNRLRNHASGALLDDHVPVEEIVSRALSLRGGRDFVFSHVDPRVRLMCCPEQMAAALAIILDSATNASPALDYVRLAASPGEKDSVIFRVSDHGPGVSGEARRRAFDLSSKQVSNRPSGGLAQARALVESCGGRIRFDSEIGKGSVVSVGQPVSV